MKVEIINKSKHELPKYETEFSAGMDLKANLDETITLKPLERIMVPTGLYIKLPEGYEAQIRPRSGLAIKHGISVINSPGTIDSDFIGQVMVLLINLSNNDFFINDGDRIGQMIINKYEKIIWSVVDKLEETKRGEGGFGSTGEK